MSEKQKKIKTELRAICRFRALRQTRIVLILLLLCLFYAFHHMSLYLALTLLCFPAALEYAMRSARPEQNRQYLAQASLPVTMQRHHFVYTAYRAETISALLIILLLALWQWVQPQSFWYDLPVWRTPGLLLAIYYITENAIYFYYRYRIHHDFMHVNIR